jgi:DNA-binding response OmpR family regulator
MEGDPAVCGAGEDAVGDERVEVDVAEVRDRVRGLRTGADEYVGKPYQRPYLVARARELVRAAAPADSPAAPGVLVIDDSATFLRALRAALEGAGYAVSTAATGEDGLRAAVDLRPAAIVVDGVLPGIDGATVIRRFRALTPAAGRDRTPLNSAV